jgi:alcohol dehydrogenase
LRNAGIEVVVALGGGSVMDSGKALAATLSSKVANPLEEVFRAGNNPSWSCRLPLITIPTTAGTGAEVTPFATVWDHELHRKHSLSGPLMFPDLAILDASLTLTLFEEETLFPGLDSVSHALESLWNRHCTPVSRALALQSLALVLRALPSVLVEPLSITYRRDLQAASLLAGMAISQTRTALAHSISYPVTTHFGVPHGLACSFTLPALLELNLETMATSAIEHQLLSSVLSMLKGFGLSERVRSYFVPDSLESLHDEMITPGRSDNYNGVNVSDIGHLLYKALS